MWESPKRFRTFSAFHIQHNRNEHYGMFYVSFSTAEPPLNYIYTNLSL